MEIKRSIKRSFAVLGAIGMLVLAGCGGGSGSGGGSTATKAENPRLSNWWKKRARS